VLYKEPIRNFLIPAFRVKSSARSADQAKARRAAIDRSGAPSGAPIKRQRPTFAARYLRQLDRCLFSAALPGRRRAIKTFPQCEIGHILRRRRFLYSGGHSRPSGGYGNHEDHAGSSCDSWPVGARDKWCERIPIEGKRLSIISKLRPARVCESVVLLVENQP
jgi:hypothetical protein